MCGSGNGGHPTDELAVVDAVRTATSARAWTRMSASAVGKVLTGVDRAGARPD
ncbi:hypothetical protein ACI8AC_08325 [Geodermatophilus sp. SYSU D00758]